MTVTRNLLVSMVVLALSGIPAMLPEVAFQSQCPYCTSMTCCMMHHCNMGKGGLMSCPMARGAHHCGSMAHSCATNQRNFIPPQNGRANFHYDLPRSFAVFPRPAVNGRLSHADYFPLKGYFFLPDHVPKASC